jgi:hypothetical protein
LVKVATGAGMKKPQALGSHQSVEEGMLAQIRKVREIRCICGVKQAVFGLGKRLAIGLEPSVDVSEFDRRFAPLERALGLNKTASQSKSLPGVFGQI